MIKTYKALKDFSYAKAGSIFIYDTETDCYIHTDNKYDSDDFSVFESEIFTSIPASLVENDTDLFEEYNPYIKVKDPITEDNKVYDTKTNDEIVLRIEQLNQLISAIENGLNNYTDEESINAALDYCSLLGKEISTLKWVLNI